MEHSPAAEALEFERNILQNWPELSEVLISQGVQASRRALRLYPTELEWGFGDGAMTLSFVLPPGAYATTVLGEILMYSVAEQSMDQEQ